MNNKDNNYYVDPVKLYLKEISKYDGLDANQEVELFNKIKNYQDMKLLKIKSKSHGVKYNIYYLDKILLFKSLVDNELYKVIIDSLIELYCRIDSPNEDVDVKYLLKYKKIADKLGRVLNDEDLEKYFKLDSNIEINKLSNIELLKEVENFITFKETYYKIIVNNLKLVVSFAKEKAIKYGMPLMDLINDGNFALMRAIDLFDIERGNKFSTYASECIKSALKRSYLTNKDNIRLPINYKTSQIKFFYQVDALEQRYQRKLSYEEISKELNISIEQVKEFYDNNFSYVSQNKAVGEDEDAELVDFLPDESSNGFDENIYSKDLVNRIEILYNCLNEREKLIVQMMFGLGKYQNNKLTLEKAGKEIGVTRESVRQAFARALFKMKNYVKRNPEANALKEYVR